MSPARSRELVWGDAEMLLEQPTQMTRGRRQPSCQIRFTAVVQCSRNDQLHGPAHQGGSMCGDTRLRAIRPAPQARAITRGLGRSGHLEGAHVVGPRAGAATGAAVYARRAHGRELHRHFIPRGTDEQWPDSDRYQP